MALFNSLGSNYDFGFVLKALFSKSNKKSHTDLKTFLEEKYGSKAILVYKGREALRLALRAGFLKKREKWRTRQLSLKAQ